MDDSASAGEAVCECSMAARACRCFKDIRMTWTGITVTVKASLPATRINFCMERSATMGSELAHASRPGAT